MALAATAILAASCAKDIMTKEEFDEGLFVKTTISADATLPGTDSIADADKAYVDGITRKVIWQSGDQLRINGTDLTVAEIDSGGVRAKFYGTVGAIPDGGNFRYWAVYPKTLATASTMNGPSTLTITLPETRQIDPSKNPLEGYSYMAGHAVVPPTASRIHFQMRNLGAVLKLTLTANANDFNRRIDSIVFTSTSTNANLSGQFNINNASIPTISQGTGKTRHKVTFTGGSLDISSQKTIYVFLPPLSGKNLTMRIYGGYGLVSYVEKKVSSITLERNKIYEYSNPNISFDKVFTVNKIKGTKVIFSPGNLQYKAGSTVGNSAHFQFAPNQYSYVGSNNSQISSTNNGWIDLFGWGTSGNVRAPYYSNTTNTNYGNGTANINGTDYDWGRYNAIYNPKIGTTYGANNWRTLTRAEWDTLLFYRTNTKVNNTNNARYTLANLTDVGSGTKGIILFPDSYSGGTPSGVTWGKINDFTTGQWGTTCTAAGWTALEQAGCVFLPAAGYRTGTTVDKVNTQAYYWTATHYSTDKAYHVFRGSNELVVSDNGRRHLGLSVRLARTHK